jgi:hypothetical protein
VEPADLVALQLFLLGFILMELELQALQEMLV